MDILSPLNIYVNLYQQINVIYVIDLKFQIHHQFPCSFEFNETFLVFLSGEAYSSRFGTFIGNNEGERVRMRVRDETVSLWSYTNRPSVLSRFINCMYEPNVGIIWPSVAPVSLVSIILSFYLRCWLQIDLPVWSIIHNINTHRCCGVVCICDM